MVGYFAIYENFRNKICVYEILRIPLRYQHINGATPCVPHCLYQRQRAGESRAFRSAKPHCTVTSNTSVMSNIKPTEAELEILQILWEKGPSTVRTVNELLNTRREVGYTTTLKLMQIMFEKGLATRMEEGRTHVYTAALDEQDTQRRLLQQFVDTAFRGNASRLMLQLLGDHQADAAELEAIKALIEQMEK